MSIKLVSFLKQSSQVFQRTSLLGIKQTNLPIKCQIGWKRGQKKVFSILHKQNELLCINVCIKQTNKKDSSRCSCVVHVKVWRGFKRTYPVTVGVTQDRVKAENVVTDMCRTSHIPELGGGSAMGQPPSHGKSLSCLFETTCQMATKPMLLQWKGLTCSKASL